MIIPVSSPIKSSPMASDIKCSRSVVPAGPTVIMMMPYDGVAGQFRLPQATRRWDVMDFDAGVWVGERPGAITDVNEGGNWTVIVASLAWSYYHPTAVITYDNGEDIVYARIWGLTSGTTCYYSWDATGYDEYDTGHGGPLLSDRTPDSYEEVTLQAGQMVEYAPEEGYMACFFPGWEPSDFSWYPL